MTCLVSHTSVDCHNAYELSEWWKALLGYVDVDGDPNEPGHEECMILDPASGHHILFIEVPEAKDGKNRLHFDLVPRSGTRDEETERVLGNGATMVNDLRGHWGPAPAGPCSPTPRATSSACCGRRPRRRRPAPEPRPQRNRPSPMPTRRDVLRLSDSRRSPRRSRPWPRAAATHPSHADDVDLVSSDVSSLPATPTRIAPVVRPMHRLAGGLYGALAGRPGTSRSRRTRSPSRSR